MTTYYMYLAITIISLNLMKPHRTSWNLLKTGKIYWNVTEPSGT